MSEMAPKESSCGREPQYLPDRLRAFAEFFKGYMRVSAVVAAALPIPVTAFGLIPTLDGHTKVLSVLAPLFCFLALGNAFYLRHRLASAMFPEALVVIARAGVERRAAFIRALPLWLSMATAVLSGLYLFAYYRKPYFEDDGSYSVLDTFIIDFFIPLLYIGVFVSAVGAFAIMALREYLQDVLGFSEIDLIYGRTIPSGRDPIPPSR